MRNYQFVLILTLLMQATLFLGCNNRKPEQQANLEIKGRDSVVIGVVGDHLKAVWQSLDLIDTRLKEVEREEAKVTTEEELFGVAKTQFGAFPVISKSAIPYLDGYKVKLMIGNLTSATFHGVKVKITWGPAYGIDGSKAIQEQKSKVFDLTTIFPPGKYTSVELALTPAKPEEIKKILVGLEFAQMSLAR